MNNSGKNVFIWVIIAIVLVLVFNLFNQNQNQPRSTKLPYSEFLKLVDTDKVNDVSIVGRTISGHLDDGSKFSTYTPPNDPKLIEKLSTRNVIINSGPEEEAVSPLLGLFLNWLPMLLFIGVWIFFMRQMQGKGGGSLGFGRSKAKLLTEKHGKVTFKDVAGVDEAKEELEEVVEYLRNPIKFQRLGGKIPKGVLLVGPPGTGKTLIARAVAGEANVPFFTISGSDFVEMFVGVGASRVRDMFEQGKKNAPCIIFVDEIDAVGRHRGAGLGGGNDEREQTLNQLLVEMDGFETNEGVILIAATNRPDVLDPALLRPGRFDRQVVVPNPDIVGREKILKVHMKKVPLASDVNARTIARGTPGFSGADLANIVNEAALLAARKDKKNVSMHEFEEAKDKVMMGSERRSMVMTEDEKEKTAYHEAGHALVMLNAKGHEPLHKVTIIPRGRALGVTMWLPERDKLAHTYNELNAQLASLFGGRIAEELIYGKDNITTGAGNDIQQATNLAKRMVKEFGFSDKLGPLRYESNQEEVFLGHSVSQQTNISDETARIIDSEVKVLVKKGEATAKEIINSKLKDLHIIAKGLLEFETLTASEIKDLLKGKKIVKEEQQKNSKSDKPEKEKSKKNTEKKPIGSVPLTVKNTS
ncbi:MAG: cell division protein FtsH [Alphaproteobacteria bacterium TMED62]|nr:MAG: cell division protein FtsH [Alphaproteobacteria bacterium TMED62]